MSSRFFALENVNSRRIADFCLQKVLILWYRYCFAKFSIFHSFLSYFFSVFSKSSLFKKKLLLDWTSAKNANSLVTFIVPLNSAILRLLSPRPRGHRGHQKVSSLTTLCCPRSAPIFNPFSSLALFLGSIFANQVNVGNH